MGGKKMETNGDGFLADAGCRERPPSSSYVPMSHPMTVPPPYWPLGIVPYPSRSGPTGPPRRRPGASQNLAACDSRLVGPPLVGGPVGCDVQTRPADQRQPCKMQETEMRPRGAGLKIGVDGRETRWLVARFLQHQPVYFPCLLRSRCARTSRSTVRCAA